MRTGVLTTGLLLTAALQAFAMITEVNIKGTDDGVKTTKQQDYREAVLNAKMQAIERSGEPVQPLLAITNFQLRAQAVEARAKRVLLPGFQIVDIGYVESGSYEVVLVAKVRSAGASEPAAASGPAAPDDQQVQAAIDLHKRGMTKPALRSLETLISSADGQVRTEALMAKGLILAGDARTVSKSLRILDQLRKAAPDSPETQQLETVLLYKYIRFKLHNDVPRLKENKVISGIQERSPYAFTYEDETGKRDTFSFPASSVCVNDDCRAFRHKVMRDRQEITVGRYFIAKDCKTWTDVTRSTINPQDIDVDCVMTIERTDLGF